MINKLEKTLNITKIGSSGGSRMCKRRGHILAEKRLLASLYPKNARKVNIFTKKGGVRQLRPMLDPPLGSKVN